MQLITLEIATEWVSEWVSEIDEERKRKDYQRMKLRDK